MRAKRMMVFVSIVLCGAGLAMGQTVWQDHPDNPVIGADDPGSWAPGGSWVSAVVNDGTTYHMWFSGMKVDDSGWITGVAVGHATSPDGIAWTMDPANPVITPGDPGEWDDLETGGGAVIYDGTQFKMWYSHFGADRTSSVSYATSDCCAGIAALDKWRYIPAAAVASGAQGAFYQTDIDVSNADSVAAQYQFIWLPRGENNTEATGSEIFSLDAGMSVRYSNVLNEVFGLEPNSLGALMVFLTSPDLLFMSRTYNNPSGGAAGTFGQAIPPITQDDFIRGGDRKRILFGSENADFRFNVGCQNGRADAALVQLELVAADGTSLETKMMLLRPWGNDQLNRIFEDHRPVTGYVDVWASSPDAYFYCYGSLLDNTTSDPTTIPPQ